VSDDKKTVFENVHPDRREFFKKLLAGAAFATPVIATFSIDALTADSANAESSFCFPNSTANITSCNQCPADAGYVGPSLFEAHVSTSLSNDPQDSGPKGPHRVNGQAIFQLNLLKGSIPSVLSIIGTINMVFDATITSAAIMVGGRVAVNLLILGGNSFQIHNSNVASFVCDLDELADLMASRDTTLTVKGMYLGSPYTVSGAIVPDPSSSGPTILVP